MIFIFIIIMFFLLNNIVRNDVQYYFDVDKIIDYVLNYIDINFC